MFLLCRSENRKRKEEAMHERFNARIVDGLKKLGRRLKHAKQPADRIQVERQIDRLLEQDRRAGAKYTIKVKDDPKRASGLRLVWSVNEAWQDWAALTEGTYILRSNVADWSSEELWQTYIQLHHAEAAFRIQKTDLRIRPIWHQREDRMLAHILVCFLAFAMWKTLEGRRRRAGLGSSPRTLLEEMKRIQTVDVVLPFERGGEMRLRCAVEPDGETGVLPDRLDLRLPRRLRLPSLPAEM
ncbi:MAG: hypothetical protein IPM29_27235 [Planctomycetes bacterium]|nr:hypothetical protein [Planctomycetota bacterium]